MPKFPKNTGFQLKGFPFPGDKFDVKDSKIHGKGNFAKEDIKKGELIGTNVHDGGTNPPVTGNWTTLAQNTNHQDNNNAVLKQDSDDYNLYAEKNIKSGDEITMDYKNTPWWVDSDTTGFNKG
tara:strand:- start:172 stop:540 length:369 start_codon:yes stop_codon:yes gene_type:complete